MSSGTAVLGEASFFSNVRSKIGDSDTTLLATLMTRKRGRREIHISRVAWRTKNIGQV
jgi:hypothetical protein